ncbi:hypothetical protein CDA63_09045 [Hymenobacter amundsenii]|uniref:Uncharacterized protein n=2 Tax=Hymenobacter amundsenii TaxID=2006685 RepID=A0A246FLB2_9BACT|nr:hypothetical protein CDA63_09045 [Hymenobacter amundsenii]
MRDTLLYWTIPSGLWYLFMLQFNAYDGNEWASEGIMITLFNHATLLLGIIFLLAMPGAFSLVAGEKQPMYSTRNKLAVLLLNMASAFIALIESFRHPLPYGLISVGFLAAAYRSAKAYDRVSYPE